MLTEAARGSVFGGLCAFGLGETEFETLPETMQELRDTLADLAEQGTTYLGRLVGEQTLLSVQKVRNGSSPVSSVELAHDQVLLALIRNDNNNQFKFREGSCSLSHR